MKHFQVRPKFNLILSWNAGERQLGGCSVSKKGPRRPVLAVHSSIEPTAILRHGSAYAESGSG